MVKQDLPLIFFGNSNPRLAADIATYLGTSPARAIVSHFSDGETMVEIGENVRGKNCFIIQSTCSPANHHIMELLVIMDALRRSSAGQIIAVIPYYGYARQDRKVAPRTPITSKLVADMLTAAGASRVVSIDLHAGQIQGFFNVPFDHLYAAPVFLEDIRRRFEKPPVIVSPDAGGTERARAYSKRLNSTLAIVDKRRSAPNVSEVMNIIGDVAGQPALLLDDLIDTGGTIAQAAEELQKRDVTEVAAYAVHPVLSGPAVERIEKSPLKELVVTDTIPLQENARRCPKIRVLSVAPLLAEAVKRIHMQDSVSALFV